jgi:hypothetical protein
LSGGHKGPACLQPKGINVKDYLKRLAEVAVVGGLSAGGAYVTQNGFDLSQAGVTALLAAIGVAAYGVVVKKLGSDVDRPTVK